VNTAKLADTAGKSSPTRGHGLDGLKQLTTVEQIARERGVEPSSIQYRSRAKSRETA